MSSRTRGSTIAAGAIVGVAAIEVALAVVGSLVWLSWEQALGGFVVSNALIGASCLCAGALLMRHRPANPIGWLLGAASVAQSASAAAIPLLYTSARTSTNSGWTRTLETIAAWAWPLSIGTLIPLALLLFPTGRPASPRWHWFVVAAVISGPLFAVEAGSDPRPNNTQGPPVVGYLTISEYHRLAALWTVSEFRVVVVFVAALVSLMVRYRRGGDVLRRQLLWLLLALLVMVLGLVPWAFISGTPIIVLFAIPLVPAAITLAILRYNLLDIRVLVLRTTVYLALSGCAVAAYLLVVLAVGQLTGSHHRLGVTALASVLIAVCFNPLRVRLQRVAERFLYGDRRDPVRALSQLNRQLDDENATIEDALQATATSLRLPSVAVVIAGRPLVQYGSMTATVQRFALGPITDGELIVGVRSGERALSTADRNVLQLLCTPLAVAVRATELGRELQASRASIVSGREEERRRLRRDLHDGLGPALSGMAFAADAAGNLVCSDPDRAHELIVALRNDIANAVDEIRRLVEGLRPPALDELGLLGALGRELDRFGYRRDGVVLQVTLDAPDQLPAMSAAVEVAAYRIAVEAVNNVARHSQASRADVLVRVDGALHLDIVDDGGLQAASLEAGVGMSSMRERASEVGGRCDVIIAATGARVSAVLPLDVDLHL